MEWGITSVSVSPDMIDTTRDIIAKVESRVGDTTSGNGIGQNST